MASKKNTLIAQSREKTGRKVKSLRREGIVPANVFGKGIDSTSVQMNVKEFISVYKEAGETSVIDLTVEGHKEVRPVLVSNIQKHPVTGDVLHVDLHQVDLKQKVTATVPFEFTGESPAVKDLDGVLITTMSQIDVESLPTDIPEGFTLDISSLAEIGSALTVADIQVDRDLVTLQAADEEPIVLIQAKKIKEEEPEEEVEEGAEGEEGAESTDKKPAEDAEKNEDKKSDDK